MHHLRFTMGQKNIEKATTKLFSLLAIFALVAMLGLAQIASVRAVTVGSNVKVIDDSGTSFPAGDQFKRQQNEPWIAADPSMAGVLVAGSNDYRGVPFYGDAWAGYYRSTDYGASWTNNLVPGFPNDNSPAGLASPIHGLGSAGDPMMEFDSQGNLYYAGIAFNRGTSVNEGGQQTNADNANAIWVAKYTSHGATYDHTTAVSFTGGGVGVFEDKVCIAVDTTGGSTDGNVYVAWSRFLGNAVKPDTSGVGLFGGVRLMFSASYDGGNTYTTPKVTAVASQNGDILLQGCSIAVAPNSDVYIAYRTFASGSQFEPTPRTFDFVKSTDSGKHFSAPRTITSFVAVPSPLDGISYHFRTPTFAFLEADSAGIYLAYQYNPSGSDRAEIGLQRSTNGGATWSFTPVNSNSASDEFWPTMSVSNGKIHVAYYSNQGNSPTGMLDVYYAESTNNGASFLSPVKVTSVASNANYLMFGGGTVAFHGDYIGIASDSTHAFVVWTDNRDFVCPGTNAGGCLDPTYPNNPSNNIGNKNQNIYSDTITGV